MASNVSRHFCAKLSSHVRSGNHLIAAGSGPGPNLSVLVSRISLRTLSTSGGGGKGSGSGSGSGDNDDDPFGVNFEDGETNIGPKDSLPPNYIRDPATGKFTGEIKEEASDEDKRLLNLGPIGNEHLLKQRFEQSIGKNIPEDGKLIGDGEGHSLDSIASRIREEKGALSTIGRKPADIQKALEEQGIPVNPGENTAPLTEEELTSLYKFIDKIDTSSEDTFANTEKVVKESEDMQLMPTIAHRGSNPPTDANEPDEDNPDLEVNWMSIKAQRDATAMDAEDLENPFSNLMPIDFAPNKKVNRQRAKPIPKDLLHHNNIQLLRRYVTPGGQIMKRVQTRLGAKDQRKIAKLVKRARHLGLIPFLGQWKMEDHGNIKDPSLLEDTDWEKRLLERGLVTRESPLWEEKKKSHDPSSGW